MNPSPSTDWRAVDGWKRGLPLGDRGAVASAFVPTCGRVVLVYQFGTVSYHEPLTDRLVQDPLRFAKPLGASTGERMDGTPE
jgi:hypothetical protein